jgi:hypothetical protein
LREFLKSLRRHVQAMAALQRSRRDRRLKPRPKRGFHARLRSRFGHSANNNGVGGPARRSFQVIYGVLIRQPSGIAKTVWADFSVWQGNRSGEGSVANTGTPSVFNENGPALITTGFPRRFQRRSAATFYFFRCDVICKTTRDASAIFVKDRRRTLSVFSPHAGIYEALNEGGVRFS